MADVDTLHKTLEKLRAVTEESRARGEKDKAERFDTYMRKVSRMILNLEAE